MRFGFAWNMDSDYNQAENQSNAAKIYDADSTTLTEEVIVITLYFEVDCTGLIIPQIKV